MNHYYQILGLEPGADKDAIKKAYRRLAMKYHPDVNPGAEARDKFLEVLEAYEYLMGIREYQKKKFSEEDLRKAAEVMVEWARQQAKAKYRERVYKLRKEREKEQARQYTQAIYLLIGLVVMYFTLSWGWGWYKDLMIDNAPVYTTATVVGVGQNRVLYQFEVNDEVREERDYVSRDGFTMLTDEGLPLEIGDEFELIYQEGNPDFHRLNYRKMSAETFNRYMLSVSNALQQWLREEGTDISPEVLKLRADCLTLLIFQEYEFNGLSMVLHRDSFFLENLGHNSLRWYLMSHSDTFQGLIKQCRGEAD
ncbi:MAG TPA: hypothetical protein DCG19_01100 [Cryomorphaceae bacterium]|nr:hypothetical protein [Owenweeksia sp.]MBF98812.1 hypothetical protein [Owenweeksia sp.]HAD95965.1 hypothetical protein [Cryomorphaceae bacterium]HBF20385.1 hypothetical protein [Cryomorphaceae bacterium]